MLGGDGAFRGEAVAAPVEVGAEGDAVLVDLAQRTERHHLKPARIGEDRPRPVHEPVQAAKPRDALRAGAEEEVIGIGEHHLRPRRPHRLRRHRLDRGRGADRHETGGEHLAMRGGETSSPRRAGGGGGLGLQGEAERHARSRSEASP